MWHFTNQTHIIDCPSCKKVNEEFVEPVLGQMTLDFPLKPNLQLNEVWSTTATAAAAAAM